MLYPHLQCAATAAQPGLLVVTVCSPTSSQCGDQLSHGVDRLDLCDLVCVGLVVPNMFHKTAVPNDCIGSSQPSQTLCATFSAGVMTGG
jgi:hypothetical protein